MPDSHAESSSGLLFIANGIDPVLRWDGLSDEAVPAGVAAPTAAITLALATDLVDPDNDNDDADYYAFVRYYDAEGNFSSLSPISEVLTVPQDSPVRYSGVPTPSDDKVVGRQILRNTAGQTLVFYVDVDTNDLTTDSFTSTRSDSELATQLFQALIDPQNRDLSTIYEPPPDWHKCIAAHLDRLFLAGEEVYSEGCVSVTLGSTSVTGVGTEWPGNFAGRFLWVDGADKAYEISSLDAPTQTITLLEAYGGPTNPYASYAVRPAMPLRRQVAFSEAGLPEAWPPTSAVSVQEDGDVLTGLMPKGSFVYILEARHLYRLTFQADPLQDGYVFRTLGRGCINNRSWVVVDEAAYLLDEQGCYSFSGGATEALSEPIQDLFQAGLGKDPLYRVQWPAARWFHACYDPGRQVIRWFVTLAGQGLPRHALCLEVRQKRWWLEEYPFPVGASCVASFRGRRRVFLGGPGGQVYLLGAGTLDGVDHTKGTVRGTVTASGVNWLEDSSASYGSDVAGCPVAIVSGTGIRQVRKITAVVDGRLKLDSPWLVRPDATSTYQLGGIQWRYRTGWFRWAESEDENERRLEVVFEPLTQDSLLQARVYKDRSKDPIEWGYTLTSEQSDGFASEEGSVDLTGDLTKDIGLIQKRLQDHKDVYIDGWRYVSLGLDGVANSEAVELVQLSLEGARGGGQ